MVRIPETQHIRAILELADKKVTLSTRHQAVVVELGDADAFEGTIIYVPGVTLKELQQKG